MGLLSRLRDHLIGSPEWRQNSGGRIVAAGSVSWNATEIAHEDVSDDEARDRLRARITDVQAARTATEMLAKRRDSYLNDRAYRLLTAALDGTDVRPIDPGLREDFLREEALGRMPLEAAFEYLAQLEPELNVLLAKSVSNPASHGGRPFVQVSRGTQALVGISARSGHPLLRSDTAASIVSQYVGIRSGRLRGDVTVPYFDRRISGSFSGNFIGGVERPPATN